MQMKRTPASRWVIVAVMCITLCLSTIDMLGTAVAAPIVQTNSSWKITPENPGGTSWYTDAAFDDSGWQNATVMYDYGAVVGDPAFDGTKIIWSSGGQFSSTETQVWIRHEFSLSTPLSSASLFVGCDDDCTVWVNGTQVVNDTNGFANNTTVDPLPFSLFQVGQNLIAYTVSDNFPVFGFNHSTALQLDGVLAPVPLPGALLLFGSGLLGLMGIRVGRRMMAKAA